MGSPDAVSPAPEQPGNVPLDLTGLPRLRSEDFAPLDPAYVRLRTYGALLSGAVAAAATAAIALAASSWIPTLIGAGVIVLVVAIGVAQRLEVARMGYLVRSHDLSFRSGLLTRSVATVPFARVQHVSIGRGPLDRRFGLASLQLRTAGGHLDITGLHHDEAERLKQLVSDRAAELAELEVDDGT